MRIFSLFFMVFFSHVFLSMLVSCPQLFASDQKSEGFSCQIPDSSGSFRIAVTYESMKGRFGDQILGYLHAKWVCYRFGIPILYKPFCYSEEFALHAMEERWSEEKEKSFERIIPWVNDLSLSHLPSENALYVIPFFSDLEDDRKFHPEWSSMSVDWEDVGFRALLRSLFAPCRAHPHQLRSRNSDHLTVAVHVRRGGGKEIPNAYILWPMRFPPDSYYIQCLCELCWLFPNLPIHAHIFTDDLDPKTIAMNFQKELSGLPIHFTYREEGNGPDFHILDDFFAMMDFDCLIRSISNYTLIPSLIGDYKIVMAPQNGYWIRVNGSCPEYYISEIDIKKRY